MYKTYACLCSSSCSIDSIFDKIKPTQFRPNKISLTRWQPSISPKLYTAHLFASLCTFIHSNVFKNMPKIVGQQLKTDLGPLKIYFGILHFLWKGRRKKGGKSMIVYHCIVEFYIDFQAIQTDDVFRNRNCFIFLGAKIKSNIDYESALYGSFQKLKRNYISIFLCSSSNPAYLSGPGWLADRWLSINVGKICRLISV